MRIDLYFVYIYQSFEAIFIGLTIELQSLPLLLLLAKQECSIGAYGVLHHLSPSLHLFVGLKGVCQCDDGVPKLYYLIELSLPHNSYTPNYIVTRCKDQ